MYLSKRSQVLIVDDYPTNIKVLSDLLIEYGFEVLIARDGMNALQKLQRISPDIILLDVLMPGIDGFETCQRLKEQESTRDIPVIFMTALSDPVDKIKGLSLGAVDYITKPFQQEEVLARVNTHLRIRHLTKQLEEQNAQLRDEARSRQLAEASLRLSEEKFVKAFRSNPGPMMILTLEEGRVLEVNQNFCKILEYPPEALLGKTIKELNIFCDSKECDRFLAVLQQNDVVSRQEWLFSTLLGEIKILLVSAEIIQVRELTCILAMMFDITACKKAAAELQQAKAAAEGANQAKSFFLANISHELRMSLNIILGYTQLMNRDDSLNSQQRDYLNIINQGSEHLFVLINDVLEMTRIESGLLTLNSKSVNLNVFVNTIYEMLRPKADEKKLGFTTEFSPEMPSYIQADETKLRQILINLLSNAIKFTNQGLVRLRVGVASRADGKTDPNSDVSALAPPNHPAPESELIHLLFEVTDTGPGIAPDELEVLFDPFVQTEVGRRSQEGTGLGLPISQRFVQFMGGSITVKSTVGAGSAFAVEIPVMLAHPSEDQSIQPKGRVVGLAPGQPNYRILVVDDQTLNRKLLVKLLTAIGFDVQEATQGEEAIAIYQSWQPHLIWMDVRMPVMDGYEVTRRIRQLQTNYETVNSSGYRGGAAAAPQSIIVPKIIALTANVFAEDRSAALAAGYDDFVCKPIQEADLLEKISEHLGVRYLYQDSNSTSNVSSRYMPSISKRVHSTSSLPAPTLISPNLQRLLQEVAGGDILIFADYIADNVAELVKLMQQLRIAVDAQDAVMLGLIAHSLRATGMTFVANSLVELCLVIEQSANAGIVTVMPEQLLQLEIEVERLITLLQLQRTELCQQ